jgi:glyoxylase-like metal-dependent hydrolase (beta-lactamase superfamily II)
VGHGGAGKTLLAEALLWKSGTIGAMGSLERGTTVCDFDPMERRVQHSLNAAIVQFEHEGTRVHLIDTPGYADFVGQAMTALEAVDCAAVLIDPELSRIDLYRGLLAQHGLTVKYVIDTHTHADHFSASRELGRLLNAHVVMHRLAPAPYADLRLDDGDMLIVGELRLKALHTPGHTRDSMSLVMADRVFTGDALLIGGTGRTDLPTGDPNELYESLFQRLLKLPPETLVYPAHEYKGRSHSTIGAEITDNPRLQKTDRAEFVAMMQNLDLSAPTHLTEALRTNMSGGKTVAQLLH